MMKNLWLLLSALASLLILSACGAEEGTTPSCKEKDFADCFTQPEGGVFLGTGGSAGGGGAGGDTAGGGGDTAGGGGDTAGGGGDTAGGGGAAGN